MSKADSTNVSASLTLTNIVLVCLILVIGGAFLYARFLYEPQADSQMTQRYAAVAQQRLAKHADLIQSEATDLAVEVVPPISQAVQAQFKRDYGRYVRALEDEGELYVDRVEAMLKEKLRAHYKDFLLAHRQVLKEEFPQHASDENVERVLAEFEHVLNKLADRYYLEEFQHQTERTVALWKRFEPLEKPGPQEPSLEEQLADYAADWAVMAMAEAGDTIASQDEYQNASSEEALQ